MQIKQVSTCVLLIISTLNLTDGLITREPQGDMKLLPPDPATDCQIWSNSDAYTIGGDLCTEFPRNYTFNGTALSITGSTIVRLEREDFTNLSHLKSLTINMNVKLQEIDNLAFSDMADLENLTITNNALLQYIESETFSGLENLQHLVLSKNDYTDFYCISQAIRGDILPSLISLDVSGNTFRCINHTDAYHLNSSTLQLLKLTSCSIGHIEGTAFNNLPHLRALFLDNNNLPTPTVLDLIYNISESSDEFTEIHIGGNTIRDPNIIFYHVGRTGISILDLSFSRFLPEIANSMYTLPGVTYLDLSVTHSRMPEVYFTSDKFPNIEYLYLSSNYLLNRPFKMSLPKLRALDLSNNANSNAYDSVFDAGFTLENMAALEVLKLNSNPITTLQQGSFQNLSELKELYLVNTSIQSFESAPFSGLNALEILDLSQNYFSKSHTINNETLIGLANLKTLILDDSMITCLADDNTFNHTPKLQLLSIKHNTMLELHHRLLFPVPLLNVLDLSYNSFQSWDLRLLEKNINLERLNLEYNQISKFTSAMLEDFSGLKDLNLKENPLSCYCDDVSTLFPYIDTTNDTHQRALIAAISKPQTFCSLPNDRRFLSFLETANQLKIDECENKNLAFILKLVIIFGCFGVFVSIPTVYYLRWHIKYWAFLLRQAMSCYIFPKRKTPDPPGKYSYDAFVSYSNEDRGFVVRLVAMLENKPPRFRLCVFERDFAVGGVITDNVVDSLAKSKRTILILSDAFAKSTWCKWEMNLAQHKRLFFKDDQHGPLIIIKIGEIMEKHMTPTLRYLMKTRIYLQWHSDPIKQKVFWEKLRAALAAPLNDGDDDDRPALQHAVLRNGETVNNNKINNISLNYTSKSIEV